MTFGKSVVVGNQLRTLYIHLEQRGMDFIVRNVGSVKFVGATKMLVVTKEGMIPAVIGILMMMLPVIYIMTRPSLEALDDDDSE